VYTKDLKKCLDDLGGGKLWGNHLGNRHGGWRNFSNEDFKVLGGRHQREETKMELNV